MTFGAGGHSKEILRKCPEVNLFALDRDPLAYQLAKNLSEEKYAFHLHSFINYNKFYFDKS